MRARMWVGIPIGALIGLVITWWVYYRQKKISDKQEKVLARDERFDDHPSGYIEQNFLFGRKDGCYD